MIRMIRNLSLFVFVTLPFLTAQAQNDSIKERKWTLHYQATVIPQAHADFSADYTGEKSMLTKESPKVSLTTTLFIGRRLWKNASLIFNPELSGGSGLSKAQGIAGFPNGETFRIGSSTPKLYLARLYLEQRFALSPTLEQDDDNMNQVQKATPVKYLSVRAGKFSLSDFFDANNYSHDPRTQFLNWSLMSAGAWDYPANTRGYTIGGIVEYHSPLFAVRGGITQVPKEANGPDLDAHIGKAFGTIAEVEKTFPFSKEENLVVRVAGFYNQAHMGNYTDALYTLPVPDVTSTRKYGRTKSGFYLNTEYNRAHGGFFLRASSNDGKNETWAFTEIDQSYSIGASFDGSRWHRDHDQWGVAVVNNGISNPHRLYLEKGGYGFIVGDGRLNYGTESILELYYSFALDRLHVSVSPDYQFVLHPAYNKDRGPVNVFGVRFHLAL